MLDTRGPYKLWIFKWGKAGKKIQILEILYKRGQRVKMFDWKSAQTNVMLFWANKPLTYYGY